jgi:hypothetical protein
MEIIGRWQGFSSLSPLNTRLRLTGSLTEQWTQHRLNVLVSHTLCARLLGVEATICKGVHRPSCESKKRRYKRIETGQFC